MAEIHVKFKAYEKALELYKQALSILPSVKDSGELVVPITYLEPFALNQIGLVYKKQGQVDLALQFFHKALSKDSFERHHIYNNIGLIYFEKGKYSQALEAYQEAQKYGNSGDGSASGFILNNIGLVYGRMGANTQALETYRQALALFREFNDRPGERTTLSNIGSLLEKQNKPELAIAFYKEAVNITEAIRQDLQKLTIEEQKAYTQTVADTYRSLADLLLSQGRILEAQQVLELLKVSACETALGETGQDGTEITGLSYYFLEKGAKAVMASLWQVNDESTRLLMEQFYSNLAKSTAQSPITKAQALRQAQLSMIGSDRTTPALTNSRSLVVEARPGGQTSSSKALGFSHPYYWAPFILIGNGL